MQLYEGNVISRKARIPVAIMHEAQRRSHWTKVSIHTNVSAMGS
jgi:hypothetical protein